MFYNDLPPDEAAPFLDALSPDQPLCYLAEPVTVTPRRWGAVARTYVITAQDKAIAPAVQSVMADHADAMTPDNPFRRITLDSGHSPYASRPAELARLIAGVNAAGANAAGANA